MNKILLILMIVMSILAVFFAGVVFVPSMRDIPVIKNFFKVEAPLEKIINVQFATVKETEDILKKVSQQQEKIEEREKELRSSIQLNEKLKTELVENRKKIEEMQGIVQKYLIALNESEMKNIKRLANVYSLMRAEEAAVILADLDEETILNILSQMKERQSAKLLGAYAALGDDESLRAAELSQRLQRHTILSTPSE